MVPEEVGARLGGLVPEAQQSVSGGGEHARATVDVPVAGWVDAIRAARDDEELACDFFDWLTGVDQQEEGFAVVAHLWSTRHRHGVLVRTRVGPEEPALASVVEIYPGAAWHERETHEMFGIGFPGHPDLAPLLLPPEFEGHPLRKDFVLASRVAKPWPGAKEPGESRAGSGRRQPMRPPGVPAPDEWGPAATDPAAKGQPGTDSPGTDPAAKDQPGTDPTATDPTATGPAATGQPGTDSAGAGRAAADPAGRAPEGE